jgi:peptidyl-prolyl cis-trans isomerase C
MALAALIAVMSLPGGPGIARAQGTGSSSAKSAGTKSGTTKSAASKSGSKSTTAGKSAKPAAPRDTSRVLVRVGGEPITRAMVQARLDAMPEQYRAQFASPSGRQQLLDRMIEEKIWLTTALRNGVGDRPKVREQLEQQRRDLLIRTWINEQMAAGPAPSDSEARAYYNEHLSEYRIPGTVALRHIQLKTEAEAKRVLPMAKNPKQDFAQLAQKYSADTLTRKNGGLLGSVTHDGLFPTLGSQPALAESAFALGEGKVGGPYKTDRGWHIIKVDRIQAESTRPFEQTKPMIMRQLGTQHTQELYKELLEKARKDVGVKPDSTAIKTFLSGLKPAREMFKDAQDAGTPQARIEGYRRVLEAWPQSDVAPQAQFMIGFVQSEDLKDYDAAEQSFRALLRSYPTSELAGSAQWMIDHMRTEEAPAFITQEAESSHATMPATDKPAAKHGKTGSSGKP